MARVKANKRYIGCLWKKISSIALGRINTIANRKLSDFKEPASELRLPVCVQCIMAAVAVGTHAYKKKGPTRSGCHTALFKPVFSNELGLYKTWSIGKMIGMYQHINRNDT